MVFTANIPHLTVIALYAWFQEPFTEDLPMDKFVFSPAFQFKLFQDFLKNLFCPDTTKFTIWVLMIRFLYLVIQF